jgi:hypothetical protein
MTVRKIEDCRVFFVRNISPRQVIAAFLRTQVSQCDGVEHLSQISAPRGGWRVAARQNEERILWQLGQKGFAQPIVQRREHFHRVNEENVPRRLSREGIYG